MFFAPFKFVYPTVPDLDLSMQEMHPNGEEGDNSNVVVLHLKRNFLTVVHSIQNSHCKTVSVFPAYMDFSEDIHRGVGTLQFCVVVLQFWWLSGYTLSF